MNQPLPATSNEVSNIPPKAPSLLARFGARYAVDPSKVLGTLKATCFRGDVTDEQMIALLIVADQYQLNPFTREIYAFPDTHSGIVPVVGVDGWIRIINSNPDLESILFTDGDLDDAGIPVWIECSIKLKSRILPIAIKEYFSECRRDSSPWKSHPRRMLRHKALIQCARIALGFVGIYDPDEAERIANATDVTPIAMKPKTKEPKKRIAKEIQQAPPTISIDQMTFLLDGIREEKVELSAVLARFEIGDLEELPASSFEAAAAFILDSNAHD